MNFRASFAEKIRTLYPSAPEGIEKQIAAHACQKYSGRVGRTHFAKELDDRAVHLAVRAHIRHAHTDYDELLCEGDQNREAARRVVNPTIDEIASQWSEPPP